MHIVTVHVIENDTMTFAGYAGVAKDPWTYGDMMVKSYLQSTGGERHVEYIMEVLWEGASKIAVYESTYTVYEEEDTEQDDDYEQHDDYDYHDDYEHDDGCVVVSDKLYYPPTSPHDDGCMIVSDKLYYPPTSPW